MFIDIPSNGYCAVVGLLLSRGLTLYRVSFTDLPLTVMVERDGAEIMNITVPDLAGMVSIAIIQKQGGVSCTCLLPSLYNLCVDILYIGTCRS